MYRNKVVERQINQSIKLIEKQLESLEKRINDHLLNNVDVYKKASQINKIKGIGMHTIAVILAETNGFELFENAKQLVSYSGYDVVENQSGGSAGKTRISKKGNSRIRRALFMPAFSVVKYKVGAFYKLYERTLPKHNLKMKSYVAVQKRLLTTIYALWKNNEEYDENYIPVIAKKNSHELNVTIEGKQTRINSYVSS